MATTTRRSGSGHAPAREGNARLERDPATLAPATRHYHCEEHGTWLVDREAGTGNWLLALDPEQTPWRVAADAPLCFFCGRDLEPGRGCRQGTEVEP